MLLKDYYKIQNAGHVLCDYCECDFSECEHCTVQHLLDDAYVEATRLGLIEDPDNE